MVTLVTFAHEPKRNGFESTLVQKILKKTFVDNINVLYQCFKITNKLL